MHRAGAVYGTISPRQIFTATSKRCGLAGAVLFTFALLASASAQQVDSSHGTLPTMTTLSATTSDGGRATLAIKVQAGDRGVPTGTVTFTDGRSSLGSVLLDENGVASYTVGAAGGLNGIRAVYEGDSTFQPSSSLSVAVPAASTAPTFTLSATPTTLTVKAGNFVTSTVTVTPANGFADPVLLSCSGLPANSTCAFNPVNVTPNGTAPATTPASSTLTIQTLARTGSGTGSLQDQNLSRRPIYAFVVPGLAALAGLGLSRKRAFASARFFALGLLLLGCALGLTACNPRYSYLHHPPLTDPGTTLGTFNVLVNGSSANAGTVIIPPAVQIVLTVTK